MIYNLFLFLIELKCINFNTLSGVIVCFILFVKMFFGKFLFFIINYKY